MDGGGVVMTDLFIVDAKKEEIDTEFCEKPVCPYCGEKHEDAWEWFGRDDWDGAEQEVECDDCGKPFVVVLQLEVTYSTYKKEAF